VPAQYISQWGEKIFILHATVTRMLIEGSYGMVRKKLSLRNSQIIGE